MRMVVEVKPPVEFADWDPASVSSTRLRTASELKANASTIKGQASAAGQRQRRGLYSHAAHGASTRSTRWPVRALMANSTVRARKSDSARAGQGRGCPWVRASSTKAQTASANPAEMRRRSNSGVRLGSRNAAQYISATSTAPQITARKKMRRWRASLSSASSSGAIRSSWYRLTACQLAGCSPVVQSV